MQKKILPHLRDRASKIELVGAISFGRDPKDPSRASRGWQAKLSTAMGMGRTAINDTLSVAHGEVFDRKMQIFIVGLRYQLADDLARLEQLEQFFGSGSSHQLQWPDDGSPQAPPSVAPHVETAPDPLPGDWVVEGVVDDAGSVCIRNNGVSVQMWNVHVASYEQSDGAARGKRRFFEGKRALSMAIAAALRATQRTRSPS